MLRTTTLSYGNMPFSGTCPAETPQPIKMKFCMIDYVGELTRCAKNGYHRLAGGGPTDRWNITSTFVLYFTLPFLFLYVSTAQTAEPICTHDSSNDAVCCKEVPFGGRVDMKLHLGVKPSKTPNFGTGMPNFQPNQYSWITFERWEIDKKFQRRAYTKSGSENRTVTSFLV